MDVLQVIKNDHAGIRDLLGSLVAATSPTRRLELFGEVESRLSEHLLLESDYLYPEVTEFISESRWFLGRALIFQEKIRKSLDKAAAAVKKTKSEDSAVVAVLADLEQNVLEHFENEEDHLMPRMRREISTQEREDLGVVFHDVQESWQADTRQVLA